MDLVVRDLHHSFDGVLVLDGLTLRLPSGGLTVILGESGVGKSVFLKLLIGLLRPDAGSIKVDGREIATLNEHEMLAVRRRFGLIFQHSALLASMTVGDNVMLGLIESGGTPRAQAEAVARDKLRQVGLDGVWDAWPDTLSGGMRKRVAIARALTLDPACLLYDEPTAGLDPPRTRRIQHLIRDVNQRAGVTSVVVTHDLACVAELADTVHLLHAGRLVFSGTPEALTAASDPIVRAFVHP